jgi:hypothetical protein
MNRKGVNINYEIEEVIAEEACRFIWCALYHSFQNCGPVTLGKPWGLK